MGALSLDTSGAVFVPDPRHAGATTRIRWTDLDAFTQGYVEALISGLLHVSFPPLDGEPTFSARALTFADLAPETLAAILKTCALFCESTLGGPNPYTISDRLAGEAFWATRQTGRLTASREWHGFPPLTPHLGDDGRVYLREAS